VSRLIFDSTVHTFPCPCNAVRPFTPTERVSLSLDVRYQVVFAACLVLLQQNDGSITAPLNAVWLVIVLIIYARVFFDQSHCLYLHTSHFVTLGVNLRNFRFLLFSAYKCTAPAKIYYGTSNVPGAPALSSICYRVV
jgi:hypothetical protein